MVRHLEKIFPLWVLTGLVLAGVLWLTLAPHPVGKVHVELFPGADKVVHAIMMGTLTAALIFDLRRHKKRRLTLRTLIFVALGMTLFSALDEWAQGAMHLGRTTDVHDFLADLAGILIACCASKLRIEN